MDDLPLDIPPPRDEPPLKDVPADEQHACADPQAGSWLSRLLVIGGAGLVSAAVVCWKNMGLDFDYSGWWHFVPALTFFMALLGACGVFYGVYLTLLEPAAPPSGDRFSAWGRFGLGLAFTLVGVIAKQQLIRMKDPQHEALALAVMCTIAGPVLCAWACYGTFVKDRSQRDTGLLMIIALAAFLALLLWG